MSRLSRFSIFLLQLDAVARPDTARKWQRYLRPASAALYLTFIYVWRAFYFGSSFYLCVLRKSKESLCMDWQCKGDDTLLAYANSTQQLNYIWDGNGVNRLRNCLSKVQSWTMALGALCIMHSVRIPNALARMLSWANDCAKRTLCEDVVYTDWRLTRGNNRLQTQYSYFPDGESRSIICIVHFGCVWSQLFATLLCCWWCHALAKRMFHYKWWIIKHFWFCWIGFNSSWCT